MEWQPINSARQDTLLSVMLENGAETEAYFDSEKSLWCIGGWHGEHLFYIMPHSPQPVQWKSGQ